MKNAYQLDAEIKRKESLIIQYSKKARKLPKHGPRRQVVDQLILVLQSEIRMLQWVTDEKLKPPRHMSEEAIEENNSWLT